MQYHDSDDLKLMGEFKQMAPKEFSAFVEFDKTVGRDDGSIPRKYRELIAIAVACTTQCTRKRRYSLESDCPVSFVSGLSVRWF